MNFHQQLVVSLLVVVNGVLCSQNGPIEDICNNIDHGHLGKIGSCLPKESCSTGEIVLDSCPLYTSGYECCFDEMMPGREVRGVWIATVSNIDWPRSPTSSVPTQQAEIRHLVDQLETAGINTIYFQVRPAGDALYNSTIEPWSQFLTGVQGTPPSPFWDPLEFIIDYAHKVGIEVHAWINPYRASLRRSTEHLAPNHMARLYPQFAYPYSTFIWMDPGAAEVQQRTFNVSIDLVTRYDLDGLHMDDYFYPYPVVGEYFPDNNTYANYVGDGGILSLDDWRRDNVNKLVEKVYMGIRQVKPWVKFSLSPFGIYRPQHPEGMPAPITGFDQYSQIYSDPKKWLQEGWVDVLQPQLYWRIEPPQQSYPTLLNWWLENNPHGRHIYGGMYLSRVDIDGWPLTEIRDQVHISRKNENRQRGSWGNVQFSAKMFRDNVKGTVDYFAENIYNYKALQPFLPWMAENASEDKALHLKTAPTLQIIDMTVYWNLANTGYSKVVLYRKIGPGAWAIYKVIGNHNTEMELKLQWSGECAIAGVDRYNREGKRAYFTV